MEDYERFGLYGYDSNPDAAGADPSKGTDVVLPSGTKHFEPGDPLWIGYIEGKNNDEPVAAVAGSDEAKHYERQMNTARNQSIIQMLALIGGAAWASGSFAGAAGTAADVAP